MNTCPQKSYRPRVSVFQADRRRFQGLIICYQSLKMKELLLLWEGEERVKTKAISWMF